MRQIKHTAHAVLDPIGSFRARRPTLLGMPGVVLLGFGIVIAAGLIVPALLVSVPASPHTITFVTGAGPIAIGTQSLYLLSLSVVFPSLYCVIHTTVLTLGTAVVAAVDGVLDSGIGSLRPADARKWLETTARTAVETVTLVALGFVPQLLATLVTVVTLLVVLTTGAADAGTLHLTTASHSVLYVPSLPVVTGVTHVVGALCTLWSGYVWLAAVSVVHDVSPSRVAVVVVPYVALLVYQSDLVGHLGL